MSFFDDSSLAFLPSGAAGKDGKAYSIKPTDGTGDFTFSRGSNLAATRVGPTGLIEKGRENLLKQSNNFDTTPWLLNTTSATSGQSGYDGSSDAWLLNSTGTGFPRAQQNVSTSGVFVFSVYAKAATDGFMLIRTFGADAQVWFDLSDGSISNETGAQYISSTIENIGNGWYRYSILANGSLTSVRIYPGSAYGVYSTNGNGIYIQDSQVEVGTLATEVIESGASTGKAGLLEDEPRFDYSGGATCPSLLLEPSRTQLVTQTEYFDDWDINAAGISSIQSNYAISPEGLQNAYKVNFVVQGDSDLALLKSHSVTGGSTYAYSIYIKGEGSDIGKDIVIKSKRSTGDSVGTTTFQTLTGEWKRIDFTTTYAANNTAASLRISSNDADSCLIYGAQIEQGSYPTSYIPNHSGGTITRGEDTTSSNTAVAGATQWTWFFDNTGTETDSAVKIVFQLSGANTSLRYYTTNNGRFFASGYFGEENAIGKLCVKWDGSTLTMFKNGTKSTSTSSTDIGTITQIGSFMSSNGIGAPVDLHQMLFFNEALSDADCISLTTL